MKKILTASTIALSLLAASTTQAASTYSQTKYPVVLAHGMMGWDTMLGIEYWYQIPNDLRANGANVYTTQASGLESSEVRGEQLLTQVKEILAISGQSKVNLIGHSHGGHSVRYVAAMIPNSVASVTTMATPAKGAPMADLIVNGGTAGGIGATVIQAAGTMLNLLNGGSSLGLSVSANRSLASLSTAGSAAFNAKFPQAIPTTACGEGAYEVNGVKYFSFAGTSPKTNFLDPLDLAVGLVAKAFTNGEANDGFVGRCSAHVGKVVRDNYNMNHIDFMNHVFGLRGLTTDPKAIYREQLNRLKLAGM
ncbi:MAG: triacylglycerol lipase [Moraxellaceae bacterium]|nr:triacylglycerol lipase [Moraxellaceae bacterium]MCP5176147.1 triacylglycerol lipase [Moraxellaceae bacterium]